MKIATIADPNLVEDEVGDFESTEAEISQDDPGFVFELLSTRLYSNKEGSIVREITSNCFDAHVAAGVQHPVLVKLYKEEGQSWLAFTDQGTGMTPHIMKTVYMKYLKSTKRHSNAFIGAYGLGSKSPLSYTDFFYLTTRVDGVEWQYMLHKTQKAPRLELLVSLETDLPNGTVVKIPIREESLAKFREEALQQLFYFTDVYVEGILGFDNYYRVYDFKTFKFRPLSGSTGTWYKQMHIVVDKVTYPIDWTALKMTPINVSIGLKFAIGELEIPPSRESVSYDPASIILIKKRIEECRAELTEIANSDRSKVCETISEYKLKLEQLEKNNILTMVLNDEGLRLNVERNTLNTVNPFFVSKVGFYRWRPLAHLPISFKDNPFFEYVVNKQIGNLGTTKQMKNNMDSYLMSPSGRRLYLLDNNEQPGRIKNYQLKAGTYLVTKVKRVFKYNHKSSSENTFWDHVRIEGLKSAKGSPFTDGYNKSFLIREYRRIIAEQLAKFCPNYKDVVITEATKLEYKSHFDHKAKREHGIISAIKAERRSSKYDKDSRVDIDTSNIEEYTGLLVYGSKEQYNTLRDISNLLARSLAGIKYRRGLKIQKAQKNQKRPSRVKIKSVSDYFKNNKRFMVFAASEKYTDKFITPLKGLDKNIYSLEDLCAGKCDTFNKIVASSMLAREISSQKIIPSAYFNSDRIKKLAYFSNDTAQRMQRLYSFKSDWEGNTGLFSGMLSISQEQHILSLVDLTGLRRDFTLVKQWFEGLLFFAKDELELDETEAYLPDLITYLKAKKKKLNANHYIILSPLELQWIEEGVQRLAYKKAREADRKSVPYGYRHLLVA